MRITIPSLRARGQSDVRRQSPSWRWLLLPVALMLLAAVVFWQLPIRLAPTAPTTAVVARSTLVVAVSSNGSVAAARAVDLVFPQAGSVTSVAVRVGDQVKAGQVLATIDTADLELQLQQAQAGLKSAEARLAQVKGGTATPQDLDSAKAQLESAKAQLQQTKTGTATRADIQSAQAQLDAARAKLSALQNPAPANLSSSQTQLAQAQTSLRTQRDSLSLSKTSAYNQMQQAVNSLTQAQSKYATAKQNWEFVQQTGSDPTQPNKTDASGKSVPNRVSDTQRQQYYDTFVQAEASLRSAEGNVQQAQANYDAARQNEAAQIPLLERQVANAQAQLDALMHPTANDLKQAQASVVQAQASLEKLRQGGTAAAIVQGEASVVQAQANLEKLTAPAAAPDIAAAEATLLQAQVSVAAAQRSLDQATLKAPFDALVSAVTVQEGTTSSANTAAISLVDRSKLHIDVNLSETDAGRVQIGQPVSLTFDALPTVTISGTVALIAPVATVQQNVVTYLVQVEFDPGRTPIKVGMSASADIEIQKVSNAIVVPNRAVQTAGNTRTVTVLVGTNQIPVPVPVQVGVTSNGQTEIVGCADVGSQCLRADDVVALPTTAARTTAAQTGGGGGGFGRGGGAVGIPFGR